MEDIHWAAYSGDDEELERLLEQDPGLANARDSFGRTPLHYAAGANRDQMVDLLLNNDADPNAKDEHDRTPLIEAASTGSCEVIELLKRRGADPNARDNLEARTPLMWAAYHLHSGATRALNDVSDWQEADKDGLQVLHLMAIAPGLEAQDQASGLDTYTSQLNDLLEVVGEGAIQQMLDTPGTDGYTARYLLRSRKVFYRQGHPVTPPPPPSPYWRRSHFFRRK